MSLYTRVFCEAEESSDHPIKGNSRGHKIFRWLWDEMKHGDRIESGWHRYGHDHVPPKLLRQAHQQGIIRYHGKIRNGGHEWTKIDPPGPSS